MKASKSLLAIGSAVVVLGMLAGAASATGMLSSSSQTFRAVFPRVDFRGGFGTTECPMTLEGSLHSRNIVKTRGILIGYITRVIVGPCIRGLMTMLFTTSWHIGYEDFSGVLPFINKIKTKIRNWWRQIREPFGITCLMAAEEGEPVTMEFTREAGGALTSAVLGGTIETNCGVPGTIAATSNSLTVLNSATRITVTLI